MNKGHEPHRVDSSALHKLGAAFTLVLIIILCAMYVLWQHVHPWTLSAPPPVLPPSPRLQAHAPLDRAAEYRQQRRQLESYGWMDAGHRTAHVPVERAMLLLAQPQSAATPAHAGSAR